jgi:hypothetical protein
MNLNEFKAWFEGFTENIGGTPTEVQWKRIQSKVKGISDSPTSWTFFVDRYSPYYHPHYHSPAGYQGALANSSAGMNAQMQNWVSSSSLNQYQRESPFNAQAAFQDAGRAEAKAMREEDDDGE